MKNGRVIIRIFLVLLTVAIIVLGTLLVISLVNSSGNAGNDDPGWNSLLSMPNSTAAIVIAGSVVLIAATIALILTLTGSKKHAEKDGVSNAVRFTKLHDSDLMLEGKASRQYDSDTDLKTFCENFRLFAASRLGLYYEPEVIRSFVAGLSVTRLVIMQGISGTGKTSLAYAFGQYLQNDSVIIPVQPSWKERSDMIGYFNEFTGTFNETELLQKLYEAGASDDIYITVLDEMNIARVEYYFAEFLSLLELPVSESRLIEVVSDHRESDPKRLIDGKLKLPDNMWFIGTANNDDSTMAISDKVYDRAMIIDFEKRAEPFRCKAAEPVSVSYSILTSLFNKGRAENKLSEEALKRISAFDSYLIERVQITFGNRIMKQIEAYVPVYMACGGSELEAIDGLLAKKVLRKLDSLSPVYLRSTAEDISAAMNDIFGEGSMPECSRVLQRYTGV